MEKKLYRSRTDKKLAGVFGGLGAYLNVDPTILRVIFVLLAIFSAGFPGLILYIALALLLPEEPEAPNYQPYQPQYPPQDAPPPQEPAE